MGRDTVQAHLAALDLVYTGVIEDVRKGIADVEDLDPVTEDILIGHAAELEKFQWFVRAHLENSGGELPHTGKRTGEGRRQQGALQQVAKLVRSGGVTPARSAAAASRFIRCAR